MEEKKNPDLGSRILSLLRNFWVNLLAIGVGITIGLFATDTAQRLVPLGKLYLTLLAMTVLPIVFTAITHSLGKLLRSGTASRYLLRLVVVFAIAVLLGAVTGTLGGLIGNPGGGLSGPEHSALGSILLSGPQEPSAQSHRPIGFGDFVFSMVPANVFRAFSQGESLAVIFVSILLGVSLGASRSQASQRVLEVVRGLYEAFFRILNWSLYALPFGLCCLVAGQVATMGTQYLVTLSKIIAVFYLCCGIMCLVYIGVLRLTTGLSVVTILKAFRDPLTLAFVASNSLVAMPLAFRQMEEDLKQPRDVVELVVPLGLVMNRHAYPLLFALTTVFISQIYNHPLSFSQLIQVSLAAALTGMAAIGPAASVAPMIGLLLAPLGLPVGLAVATLVETSSIVTPMVAMTHLLGSCATAALIGAKGRTDESSDLMPAQELDETARISS